MIHNVNLLKIAERRLILLIKLKKEYIPQIEVYCDVNNCVFYSNGFLNGKCNRVSITLDENKGEPRCLSCKTM